MYSNREGRRSVDSLSSTNTAGPRGDFPFHRKSPRPDSPQRRRSRRDSAASSVFSITSSSFDAANAILESGQNAISTLLQPPIIRSGLGAHTTPPASSAHKAPTSRDIPPVTLTNIQQVDASEFASYLSQVGPLYEQLRRVKEERDDEASSTATRRIISKVDSLAPDGLDEGHLRPGGKRRGVSRRRSNSSLGSHAGVESPGPAIRQRRSSSTPKKSAAQGPPPLSTIPAVYFDDEFHLENPRIFDVVSERSEVIRPAPSNDEKGGSNGHAAAPRKALATNAILQEKLSWYMDTIEMHLIQSISTASTTFFTALGALRGLHSEAAESVARIKTIRRELEKLDEEIALGGLDLVQQRRKRENLQQLHDAVSQLREVVERVAECEALVDAGQVESALDNIDALEKLIAGEQGAAHKGRPGMQLRDLRDATALQGVNNELKTLRFRVGEAYESQFLDLLVGDLRRHVEQLSTEEVLMRWSKASTRGRGGHVREASIFPSYLSSIDDLRADLLVGLTGLQRSKSLTPAMTAYREAAMRELRALVRRPLPSSNDDDNESLMSSSTRTGGRKQLSGQEKSAILARNLRALEPRDAEELLVKIYIGVTETMRRLSTQFKVLLDVSNSIGDPQGLAGLGSPILKSPPLSPVARYRPSTDALQAQEEILKAMDLANLMGQAVDMAQEKIVKMLRVRSEQATYLRPVWFLRYFTLNLHFATECEAISGRGGTQLKTVVNGHIRDFVQHHGDAEKQRLAQGMGLDQWGTFDFGDADAELLSQIVESSTQDAQAWAGYTKIYQPYEGEADAERTGAAEAAPDFASSEQPNGHGASGNGKLKTRSAVLESEAFLLPRSAVLCMRGMSHFLHLITGIPSMTADIAASLISYLQLFNSRCTQLILGAGATRSAGLKNITTKHLALASQALAFIAAIIPHVREFVRRHCGSGAGGAGANPNAPTSAGATNGITASNVMGEFDKVRRLFQEHQNSIYDKLVEIMSGRARAGAKNMQTVDWDAGGGNGAHEYMMTLVKETTLLHRNLTKHLPEGAVHMIMSPVFRAYKDTFGSAFRGVTPRTEAGRVSMLRDVEYFQARLGKVDGFEDAGDYLTNVIKSKEIASPAPPPSPLPRSSIDAAPTSTGVSTVPPVPASVTTNTTTDTTSNSLAPITVTPIVTSSSRATSPVPPPRLDAIGEKLPIPEIQAAQVAPVSK